MRAIVLLGCFLVGSGAGARLGLVAASVTGITSTASPPSPGGTAFASAFALGVLAVLSYLVQRVGGVGIGELARARAEGRSMRNSLLLAATFSAFAVVFAFGRVSPPSLIPAALVTVLLALAAIRRGPLPRLAAICGGTLYVLVGLAISPSRAF